MEKEEKMFTNQEKRKKTMTEQKEFRFLLKEKRANLSYV